MFLFQLGESKIAPAQVKKPIASLAPKTLPQLEADFLKLNSADTKALSAFLGVAKQFAKDNNDLKSQAFCGKAASWLSEKAAPDSPLGKELVNSGLLNILVKNENNPKFAVNLSHYYNLFAVADASRTKDGKIALPASSLAKLADILDSAQKNAAAKLEPQGFTQSERNYFVFANEEQANEFSKSVLARLPGKFEVNVGTAEGIFGQGYVDKKKLNGAHVVEFTCTSYTGIAAAKDTPQISNLKIKSVPSTSKAIDIRWSNVGENSAGYSDIDIIKYANGPMSLDGEGKGKTEVSGVAELWYGKGYKPSLQDGQLAKDNVKLAILRLAAVSEHIINWDPGFIKALTTGNGKAFIEEVNKSAPKIKGSASVEVFYADKGGKDNFETLKSAIIENWKLANERALIMQGQIEGINKEIKSANPDGPVFNTGELGAKLYFFQDLPPAVIDKLVGDKTLPQDLRTWLADYKANQKGSEHMGQLMAYLKANQGEDKLGAYGKMENALSKQNFSELNTLWQRTSKNSKGLRVEDRDKQSLLVRAIEDSGDKSARSGSISTIINAKISVKMEQLADCEEVEKGALHSVKVGITSKSPEGVLDCVDAFVVNKETNAVTQLKPEGGKWIADLPAGKYALVTYAQTDDGRIKTPLRGQEITVESLPEKVKEIKTPSPISAPKQSRPVIPEVANPNFGVQELRFPFTTGFSSNTYFGKSIKDAFESIHAAYNMGAGQWVLPDIMTQENLNTFLATFTNSLSTSPGFSTWCSNATAAQLVNALMSADDTWLKAHLSGPAYNSIGNLKESTDKKVRIDDANRLSGAQVVGEVSISKSIFLTQPKLLGVAFKPDLGPNPFGLEGAPDMSGLKPGEQLPFKLNGKKFVALCETQANGDAVGVFQVKKIPKVLILGVNNRSLMVYDKIVNATSVNAQVVGKIDMKNLELNPYAGIGASIPMNKSILNGTGQEFYLSYPVMAGVSSRLPLSSSLKAGLDFGVQHILSPSSAPFKVGRMALSLQKSNKSNSLTFDVHVGEHFFERMSPTYFAGAELEIGKKFPFTVGVNYEILDPAGNLKKGVPSLSLRFSLSGKD